jgi:ABC-type dipeptide/oligopeptide/nickel transport system permease component
MSRSVSIPTGNALITTTRQPKPFDDISSAASNTLLLGSIVTTSFVIMSLTVGIITSKVKEKLFDDKRVVIDTLGISKLCSNHISASLNNSKSSAIAE